MFTNSMIIRRIKKLYAEHIGLCRIDKKSIDKRIAEYKDYGVNKQWRDTKVTVSLTTYPRRIEMVKYAIFSIFLQSVKPDRIVLWLATEEFPDGKKNLPQELLLFEEYGLTIKWCANLRSYKKLIPSLIEYPQDLIITVDDDIYYHPRLIESLLNAHWQSPTCVIAGRAHKVKIRDRHFLSYRLWEKEIINEEPSYLSFPTGAGGVLWTPGALGQEVLNVNQFLNLCPYADDIWFWGMMVLNQTKCIAPVHPWTKLVYVDPKEEIEGDTLTAKNVGRNLNDYQLEAMIQKYPMIIERLESLDL